MTFPISLQPSSRHAFVLALIAGAINVFSFAPFGWWWLQFITLALLFRLTLQVPSVKRALLLGWVFGFGWLAGSIYWLYISMHDYGGMPAPMAALAVALLAAALGIFSGIACGFSTWFARRLRAPGTVTLLLVLPAAWALTEWLRGWIFSGFPWTVSGYAHANAPLGGFAPLLGVYGIGWLVALLAGCLALPFREKSGLLLMFAVLIAGVSLHQVSWTVPNGQPISVRLLQGNVPQEMKFDAEKLDDTLVLYEDMIRAAPADLIATPETALPLLLHQLPQDYLPRLSDFATATNSHLAIGIPVSDGPQQYANSVIGISPAPASRAAPALYRYDKHHLVPFGEFIPFGFQWFVDMMRIPLGSFTPGDATPVPFIVRDQRVLPNICYEDLFGGEIAGQLRTSRDEGSPTPTILLNVSNIAWFGDSIALPQHLQISQMRAIETGRPMLRATNTGATAVITPDGSVTAELPPFTRGVLTASVQGYRGITPYVLAGNALIVLLALSMLGMAWLATRRRGS